MTGSLHLGTIAGIRIEIHFSWLIILVVLTLSLATGWFPAAAPGYAAVAYWGSSLLAALLLFAAVLAHELAHSLVARAYNLPVKRITLFLFGGVSSLEEEPHRPGVEFQMAAVGPFTSFIIGGVALLAYLALSDYVPLLSALLGYLALMNILLAIFNVLPGFPLDGGRVLRSIVWKVTGSLRTATRWAAAVGQGIALLFIGGGIWLFFGGDWVNGLWFGFIGWFLVTAAQTAQSQQTLEPLFHGVIVGQVMRPVEVEVAPTCSLQRLVDGYLLPRGVRTIPVVEGEQLVGLITLSDVSHVPRAHWGDTSVGQVMRPRSTLYVAAPEQGLSDLVKNLARRDINQVPVVRHGRLVGMVSREAIVSFLEVHQSLGLAGDHHEKGASRPETPQRQTNLPSSHPDSELLAHPGPSERNTTHSQELISSR